MDSVARPSFISGESGQLFSLHFPPASTRNIHRGLLFFPPFAEELNKSRRMIALQARRCAELGYDVLVLDLYGTGDSAGDFGEATWPRWRQDMLDGLRWLQERGADVVDFWGLRTGALLALEVARDPVASEVLGRMLLWAPVQKGQIFVTQFLRLKMAADLANAGGGPGVDTKQLRAALQQGKQIEVAGYDLNPELMLPLDALDMQALLPGDGVRVDWFEMTAENRPLSPASVKLAEVWRGAGIHVAMQPVIGEAFWSTPEITLAPNLLDATTRAFEHG